MHEVVLASIFYGISIYLLLLTIYNLCFDQSVPLFIYSLNKTMSTGLVCFAFGLQFSVIKNLLIDTDTNQIVSRYVVGPFSKDIITKYKEFEYVSVFLDEKDLYQTNLWYKGNKHYKMYFFEEKESAFKFATAISNKLNIDLLDATEKGNNKWVEKETI